MTGEILRRCVHATATCLVATWILAVAPRPAFTNEPSIPSEEQKQADQVRCKFLENINATTEAPLARPKTLVILIEGLGGRPTSRGIVALQNELVVIPNTIVPAPIAQHSWRSAVSLIQKQAPGTKIILVGYSLGANNSTYVAKNVNHINELIAIQASVWGRAVAIGENVDKAIEIYNPKFWRTAGLGARRLRGVHFGYITNSDSHLFAHKDPEVHRFIFNEVKTIADPTTPEKRITRIKALPPAKTSNSDQGRLVTTPTLKPNAPPQINRSNAPTTYDACGP
jgi:hypothetical protein